MSTLRHESCYIWRTLPLVNTALESCTWYCTTSSHFACSTCLLSPGCRSGYSEVNHGDRCQINLRPSKRGSLHKMIFYSRTPFPHFTVTCILAFLQLPRSSGLMLRVKFNDGATHIGRAVHWFPFFIAVS